MDGLQNFDVQAEVVIRSRRVMPRKRKFRAPWSKILDRIFFCLISKIHKHMLRFSNDAETQFEVILKNKKNKSWVLKDISLFKDLDSVLGRYWPKLKYEESSKGRFRANMSKFERYGYIRKVDSKKYNEVTILTYEILRSECLANVRHNALITGKVVTKKNEQRKYTKKNKGFQMTDIEMENNVRSWLLEHGSQELALRGIGIENNLGRMENNFSENVRETDKMDFSSRELLEENGMENSFLGEVQEAGVIKDQDWFQELTDMSEYDVLNNTFASLNIEIPNASSTNGDRNEYAPLDIRQNTLNSLIARDDDESFAECNPEISFFEDSEWKFGEYITEKLPSITENEGNPGLNPGLSKTSKYTENEGNTGLNLNISLQDILGLNDTWLNNFQSLNLKNEDLK